MVTYYVDLVSGNDTTGNGTSALPYLTISKAFTILAGAGGEVRVAKTTAYTTVSAASLTFTKNSTTVNTSASLVGTIAVGDYIGKLTAHGNGCSSKTDSETFYRVNAVTATTLTLEQKYYGTTETVASFYKLNPITQAASAITFSTAGFGTQVSGGWNLSGTPAQDGETWVKFANRSSAVAYLNMNSAGCIVSKFNFCDMYQPVVINQSNLIQEYCTVLDCTSTNIYFAAGNGNTARNCVSSGNTGNNNFYISLVGTDLAPILIEDCVTLNSITSFPGIGPMNGQAILKVIDCAAYCCNWGFGISPQVATNGVIFENCDAYYCVNGFMATPINNLLFKTCNAYDCTIGFGSTSGTYSSFYSWTMLNCGMYRCTYGVYLYNPNSVYIKDSIFEDCNYGYYIQDYAGDQLLIGCTFTRPVTLALARTARVPTARVIGCTIDAPSLAKAYTSIGANNRFHTPIYEFQNSFGVYGKYYVFGSTMADTTNIRVSGTSPCLKITRNNQYFYQLSDECVAKIYVNSGTTKRISVYVKADASTTGTYTPKLRLNGRLKRTFAAVTSFPTTYTEYTYDTQAGDIDADGSLELWFEDVLLNNKSIYIDSISISNI